MDGSPLGGALFAGDLILQLTTEPTLYALDRRNGVQLGKHGYGKMACAPGQLAGVLYALGVLGRKPALRVLNRRTATERWRHEGAFCQVPVVRGDTLIAIDDAGVVQALHVADGRMLWRAELGGLVRTGLALSGDLAFAGTCRWGLGGPERGNWRGTLAHGLGGSCALAASTGRRARVCGDGFRPGASRTPRLWSGGVGAGLGCAADCRVGTGQRRVGGSAALTATSMG